MRRSVSVPRPITSVPDGGSATEREPVLPSTVSVSDSAAFVAAPPPRRSVAASLGSSGFATGFRAGSIEAAIAQPQARAPGQWRKDTHAGDDSLGQVRD